jgi:translation initiation factor 2 alpha subunit (eIF-2alpha)
MEDLFNVIDQNISLSQVEIDGTFEIVVYDGNGINVVKEAFEKVNQIKKDKLIDVNFHYVGAPVYNIKIVAPAYPEAENHLKLVINTLTNSLKSYNGSVDFYRT